MKFFFYVFTICIELLYANAESSIIKQEQLGTKKTFYSEDQVKLNYTIFESNLNSNHQQPLVVVMGKGETKFRYIEFANELIQMGYGPIYLLDHRGQGYSDRILKENPNAQYVDQFTSYVDDQIKFIDEIVKKDLLERKIATKPFIIAHSMGGAITNLMLRRRPDIADKVVYLNPMFEINFGSNLKKTASAIVAKFLCFMNCGSISVGPKPSKKFEYKPGKIAVSTDRERIHSSYAIEVDENIRTSQTSLEWLNEAIKATQEIQSGLKPETSSLIVSGKYDQLVKNDTLYEYACSAKNCHLVELPGGHASHQERNPVRKTVLGLVHNFFSSNSVSDSELSGCKDWYKILVKPN